MIRNSKILNQYDFSGGINISDPGHLLPDNECYANISTYDGTRNVFWDSGIKKRDGTLKVNSNEEGDDIDNGIRFYRSATPTITTIAGIHHTGETKIEYESAGTLTAITGGSSIAAGKHLYFAAWKDSLYVASGDQVVQKITYSGGWSRTNISGLTYKPQYVCLHKDRLWVAGGDMPEGYLECSGYDDDTDWSGGDGYAFNVGYKDGDPITQLIPLGDNLIIYKNDSIWVMEGDNLYNWFQKKEEEAIGCVAPKSVVDVGFGHIFLSNDNIYFFDGQEIYPVGNKIKRWLDNIPTSLRPSAAACYYNSFYRLSFASSDMTQYNDKELLLDLKYIKDGKLSWWLFDGRNISAYVPYVGPSDANGLYMCDAAAGYLRQIDTGTQDDSSNFTAEFHTKYFVFDEPNIEKQYDRLMLDCTAGIGTVNLEILKDLNDAYSLPVTINAAGGGDTFGSATLGTTYWTSQDKARLSTSIALPSELDGTAISYKLSHSGNADNVTFYGFTLSYAYKRF